MIREEVLPIICCYLILSLEKPRINPGAFCLQSLSSTTVLRPPPTCYMADLCLVLSPAVQNERQPRSTAQVRLDAIDLDPERQAEHLATTRDAAPPACPPLQSHWSPGSCIGTGAPRPKPATPPSNHRFMASLMTAETCAKLEPEDGRGQGWDS